MLWNSESLLRYRQQLLENWSVSPAPQFIAILYIKINLYQAEMNKRHLSSRWLKPKGEKDGFTGLIQEREKPSEQFPFQAG